MWQRHRHPIGAVTKNPGAAPRDTVKGGLGPQTDCEPTGGRISRLTQIGSAVRVEKYGVCIRSNSAGSLDYDHNHLHLLGRAEEDKRVVRQPACEDNAGPGPEPHGRQTAGCIIHEASGLQLRATQNRIVHMFSRWLLGVVNAWRAGRDGAKNTGCLSTSGVERVSPESSRSTLIRVN